MVNLFRNVRVTKPFRLCYACKNDLTNTVKDDYGYEYWECRCQEEETWISSQFYCPMCDDYFNASDYLKGVIPQKKTLWIANMVTHYRHDHIKWWDRKYGQNASAYYCCGHNNYDKEKIEVNNSSKRQIIRNNVNFLKDNGFNVGDFMLLQENDEKTIELISNRLGN